MARTVVLDDWSSDGRMRPRPLHDGFDYYTKGSLLVVEERGGLEERRGLSVGVHHVCMF